VAGRVIARKVGGNRSSSAWRFDFYLGRENGRNLDDSNDKRAFAVRSRTIIPTQHKNNEKRYTSGFSNIDVKNILTDCPQSVEIISDGFRLGDGWCFYKIDYPVNTNDYSLEFDAKLESRSGYGIWFRGNYSDNVKSFGVQFDPGAGGLKFLKYPETESAFYHKRYNCDNNWHHWKLHGKGSNVKVFLDGDLIFDRNDIPASGSDFGFRTWRGKVYP